MIGSTNLIMLSLPTTVALLDVKVIITKKANYQARALSLPQKKLSSSFQGHCDGMMKGFTPIINTSISGKTFECEKEFMPSSRAYSYSAILRVKCLLNGVDYLLISLGVNGG